MQQFVVPQFIDVEDKIIGPVTARQFLILLGGAVFIAVFYKIFDFALFVTSCVLVIGLSSVFAFLRINGRPFHFFVLNLFQTFKRPKLRVWNHNVSNAETDYDVADNRFVSAEIKSALEKRYSVSRLAELSLIVDTKGAYQGEGGDSEVRVERGIN